MRLYAFTVIIYLPTFPMMAAGCFCGSMIT